MSVVQEVLYRLQQERFAVAGADVEVGDVDLEDLETVFVLDDARER